MSTKEKWYDSEDPERFARGAGWFGLKWSTVIVVAVLVFSTIIGVGTWALRVATSDAKGRGDQIVRNNSELNRTEQQQMFEDLFAQIKSLDQRTELASTQVSEQRANGQDTRIAETNLSGLQNVCLEAVGKYNAAARKVLAKDWRSADLPQEIDGTDSATDCNPADSK